MKAKKNVAITETFTSLGKAFKTTDSLDGTELMVQQHEDGDLSVYIDEVEAVMSPKQAKEFFTKALGLCYNPL